MDCHMTKYLYFCNAQFNKYGYIKFLPQENGGDGVTNRVSNNLAKEWIMRHPT